MTNPGVILEINFSVLTKPWTLRVLHKKRYTKKRGQDSLATTLMHKRRIDVHENGLNIETVIHELVHAFTSELCITSCNEISSDDWEEFFSELMAKYGRDLLDLADMIMEKVKQESVVLNK